MDKATLRRTLMERREAMPVVVRQTASAVIAAHLAALIRAEKPRAVALYLPIKGEVDLTSLPKLAPDAVYALPIIGAARSMSFHIWTVDSPLTANRFGILEPKGGREVHLGLGDLILVPSVAIDHHGTRLGYGGGYYDRYLAQSAASAIGVVYQDFFLRTLPAEAHDYPFARIATGEGIVEVKPVAK